MGGICSFQGSTSEQSLTTIVPYRIIKAKPYIGDCLANKYPQVLAVWNKDNVLTPYDVTPHSHKTVLWDCPCGEHDSYRRAISETVRYDFRCPACSASNKTSLLENKVSDYLKDCGYTVLHEYQCNILPERKWVRNKRFLPFDNEVVELRLIIEVHGKQHYVANSWHMLSAQRNGTTQKYEFEQQQIRDEFKRQYALLHGYHYLVIPYTSEENDEYKILINNKIKDITTKESVTTTA